MLAIVVTSLMAAAPAQAGTTNINFDSFAPGAVLGTIGDATFVGGPTVFVPAHVATFSPPNALHTPSPCSVAQTTCYTQEIDFSTPKSAVSLRLGLDDEPAPTEFPVPYQLTGYNASGAAVAASDGNAQLPAGSYSPITTLVSVQSANTDITKAVISVGSTSTFPGCCTYARRANIDDLTFTDNAPPPPPPAPTVNITAPAGGTIFDRVDEPRFSGQVSAPSGVNRFCLTNSTAPTIPATCNQSPSLTSDGTFQSLTLPGLHSGDNTITAWVEDRLFRMAQAQVTVHVSQPDLVLSNMEVTQAVQRQLPNVMSTGFTGARVAVYNGVPLTAGKSTVVRVWVGAAFDNARPIPGVRVILAGSRNGVPLPGGALAPIEGTRTITPANAVGPPVTAQNWSDPGSAYTFRLPNSWTHGTLSLRAIVNPPGYVPAPSECGGCDANNTLTLGGVRFDQVRTVTVTPLQLLWHNSTDGNAYAASDVFDTFSSARTVSPFNINLRPYQAVIDISSIGNSSASDNDKNSQALDRVSDWESANAGNGIGDVLGVNKGVARGLTAPVVFCCDPPRINNLAVVETLRPLTGVAHEFFHQEGFRHAGANCSGDPGGFLGLLAVGWPPDEMGLLHGVGTDTRVGSGGDTGALRLYGTIDSHGNEIRNFDLMSYCAGVYRNGVPGSGTGADGSDAWISPENWTSARDTPIVRAADTPAASDSSLARSSSAGPVLRVFSIVGVTGGSARVLDVQPGFGRSSAPSHGAGGRIDVLGANGKKLSSTPVRLTMGHVNRGFVFQVLSATVPAPAGATSIRVIKGNAVVARRARPAHAPKVRLLGPRTGTRIPSSGTTVVRWSVRDPDHTPRVASIDYSTNRGHSWRTVALGITKQSFALSNSLLGRSGHARLRVRVSDGWNQGSAVSGLLNVAGAPVRAMVSEPLPDARVASDATLTLQGAGTDDNNQIAPGKDLRWYDARRFLGSGASVAVSGLRPGQHTLTLVVAGHGGNTAAAHVRIHVTPARPALILRTMPAYVAPLARSISLRLGASMPGVLWANRTRLHIARRQRTIELPIKPGYAPLVLRLMLEAGGGQSVATIVVRR